MQHEEMLEVIFKTTLKTGPCAGEHTCACPRASSRKYLCMNMTSAPNFELPVAFLLEMLGEDTLRCH